MLIKSIEPAGTADVYNMEVEDTHDFAVAGGIIAHNCYDEWRYVCMKNPIAPPVKKISEPKPYDPLSDPEDIKYDRYDFYRL